MFGSFGYKEAGLYDEYMADHPNIKIEESSPQNESDYWSALQTRLAGNSGLADIQGIDVGRLALVTQEQADKFVDLSSLDGADEYFGEFLPWKVQLATTADGAILGGGTDVGPIVVCYKPAMLEAAGLPTDREEVAALWDTWADYVDAGDQYMANAPEGTYWMDSAAGFVRAASGATGQRFSDASGELVWDTNPAVTDAWDLAVDAIDGGQVSPLTQFTPDWNKSFTSDEYATMACPSWMLTYIKGQAGDSGMGQWDVAAAPGYQNYGGSYLAIPEASEHQAEAWDLLKFLTSAESQKKIFEKAGSFPSNQGAISAISDFQDPFFNDAPTGQMFTEVLNNMPEQVIGVNDLIAESAILNAINSVAQNGTDPAQAWSDAGAAIDSAVG
ncbi:ABC transporter substrate-binding protein [Tessaracoccus palaemonis]|uniref:Extracellular solute-binding protein n=1 Tax=Tessaracoccus palaemonis TaxID=2829499 RepID=A0ABX8SK62_9ACTN|nr:extracellular solute-binding protein [Tessaracoccus palaemonis]QXT63713.1 extracellular solute-binding protein [Tessaracoccus palaemonis]